MCFTIPCTGKYSQPQIANKDILVWKKLNFQTPAYRNGLKFKSPFQDYSYTQIVYGRRQLPFVVFYIKQYLTPFIGDHREQIHDGYHSYNKIKRQSNVCEFVRMMIPKNTIYFYSPFNNEFVSEILIMPQGKVQFHNPYGMKLPYIFIP